MGGNDEFFQEWTRNGMVVRLNPAEGFRWGVEEFMLLCNQTEHNGEVICTTPVNAEESRDLFPASLIRAMAWLMVA